MRPSASSAVSASSARSAVSAVAGFTLIEVLVALVITVAALTVIAQGFSTGARNSVVAQNATRAALLAQEVITDYETGELSLTTGTKGTFSHEPDFSFETTTEADLTGLTKLTVTVFWEERNARREFALVRLMRERPAVQ
jgi:prepilin-type N-terminal cleavage/methylation domain-containing protein